MTAGEQEGRGGKKETRRTRYERSGGGRREHGYTVRVSFFFSLLLLWVDRHGTERKRAKQMIAQVKRTRAACGRSVAGDVEKEEVAISDRSEEFRR